MAESNELSINMTIYLYPNIFLNSNVLSSFEIDEKSIKGSDCFNTTRYVNGPLEKDSDEWSDPANQWKDFIAHILDYATFFKFTQESFKRADDANKSRVEIKLSLKNEIDISIVLELRISDDPFDSTFPEEAKEEVLKHLAITNILSPNAGEIGVFEIEKILVDSEMFRFYLDAVDHLFEKIHCVVRSLHEKVKDETEFIPDTKTVSDNDILKTAKSLMDRFDEAFKELAK
jgi:hypothetical protein